LVHWSSSPDEAGTDEGLVVDLDRAPPAPSRSVWRARLRWVLVAFTLGGLVAMMASVLAIAASRRVAATPTPKPAEPRVQAVTAGGIDGGLRILRSADGRMVGAEDTVYPNTGDDVWCLIRVDGKVMVEATGWRGRPAVCKWVRPATYPYLGVGSAT
jgi:hypothetical protein